MLSDWNLNFNHGSDRALDGQAGSRGGHAPGAAHHPEGAEVSAFPRERKGGIS